MAAYTTVTLSPRPGVYKGYRDGFVDLGDSANTTTFWVDSDKFRFVDGYPQTMGGVDEYTLTTSTNVNASSSFLGYVRSGVQYIQGDNTWYVLGAVNGLYAIKDGVAVNITPLKTSSTAIANSLATRKDTLGSDPLSTSNGSSSVTVTHTAHGLRTGDIITLGGFSGTYNGIADTALNATFTVTVANANSYSITVAGTANATGSTGGSSKTAATAEITVSHTAHGFSAGMRVKLSGAADTGGIVAANINKEFVIRSVTTDTFKVFTSATCTSTVSSGGGASTVDYIQIDLGETTSPPPITNPRIWSFDVFNGVLIACPGSLGGIYEWSGDVALAATAVTNAPTQANFIFVQGGKLVALGAHNGTNQKNNRIKNSAVGDRTDWTVTTTTDSEAYEDDKEEVGKFTGAIKVSGGRVILFSSDYRTYSLDEIGGKDVWQFGTISKESGAVAISAAIEVNGICYFRGPDDFYRINGNYLEPLPNNTVREYVNYTAGGSLMHVHYVERYRELHWHFSTGLLDEYADEYVAVNIQDWTWVFGYAPRTAYIRGANTVYGVAGNGKIYEHEIEGQVFDDALDPYVTTSYSRIGEGDVRMQLHGMEPDITLTDGYSVSVTYYSKDRSNSSPTTYGPYTADASTTKIDFLFSGRLVQRKFQLAGGGGALARISGWKEFIKQGSRF